jgi:hypothetical protein
VRIAAEKCLLSCKNCSVHRHVCIVFWPEQPIAMFSFNHCVISRLGNKTDTLLLVGWAKKQHTCDDEPTIFCTNQDKNIDNEVYITGMSASIGYAAIKIFICLNIIIS